MFVVGGAQVLDLFERGGNFTHISWPFGGIGGEQALRAASSVSSALPERDKGARLIGLEAML